MNLEKFVKKVSKEFSVCTSYSSLFVGGGASRTWPFALPWLARDFGGVQHFQAAVSCCDCCWLLTSAGVTQVLVE